jgi:hypothetical protein
MKGKVSYKSNKRKATKGKQQKESNKSNEKKSTKAAKGKQ